jgi:hypothetical protein
MENDEPDNNEVGDVENEEKNIEVDPPAESEGNLDTITATDSNKLDDADKDAEDLESEDSSQLKQNRRSHENIRNLKNIPVSGRNDLTCNECKKTLSILVN